MLSKIHAPTGTDTTFRPSPAKAPHPDFDFDSAFVVPEEHTARALFATLPHGAAFAHRMVAAMASGLLVAVVESVCAQQMQALLGADETLVGTKIEIAHERPALPGSVLTLRGRARASGGRETVFDVTVEDRFERIATLRVVMSSVRLSRFDAGLDRKSALLAAVDARDRIAWS
jgi:predicted thioesterase